MLGLITPDPDLSVRRGTDADVERLAQIRVASWRRAYSGVISAAALRTIDHERSVQVHRKSLAKRRRGVRLLVADSKRDGLLGYASAGPGPWRAGYRGEIYELYLDPVAQGRGVGRMLLSTTLWELVGLGLRPVVVRVLAANPARFFYESCGGELVHRGFTTFGDQRLATLEFAWHKALPLPPLSAA